MSDERTPRKRIFDEQVAPKIRDLNKTCMALGMPVLLTVGYDADEYASSIVIQSNASSFLTLIKYAMESQGNLDKLSELINRHIATSGAHAHLSDLLKTRRISPEARVMLGVSKSGQPIKGREIEAGDSDGQVFFAYVEGVVDAAKRNDIEMFKAPDFAERFGITALCAVLVEFTAQEAAIALNALVETSDESTRVVAAIGSDLSDVFDESNEWMAQLIGLLSPRAALFFQE